MLEQHEEPVEDPQIDEVDIDVEDAKSSEMPIWAIAVGGVVAVAAIVLIICGATGCFAGAADDKINQPNEGEGTRTNDDTINDENATDNTRSALKLKKAAYKGAERDVKHRFVDMINKLEAHIVESISNLEENEI
jgi:hypothetical protein